MFVEVKMNNEELIKKIEKEIEKTGYPLEIEASEILESMGWLVVNQEGYLDIDFNKWRTIDICAYKRIDIPNNLFYKTLHISLIIECKKSENKAWVFFVKKKDGNIFEPLCRFGLIKSSSSPHLHELWWEKLNDIFHYENNENCAFLGHELSIKNDNNKKLSNEGGKDRLFESTQQVIKALLYQEKFLNKGIKSGLVKNIFFIRYPVIVFDGNLFVYNYKSRDIKETSYVQYYRSYISPNTFRKKLFFIEVVKKDFLLKYLEMINEEIKRFIEKINIVKSNPSLPPSGV